MYHDKIHCNVCFLETKFKARECVTLRKTIGRKVPVADGCIRTVTEKISYVANEILRSKALHRIRVWNVFILLNDPQNNSIYSFTITQREADCWNKQISDCHFHIYWEILKKVFCLLLPAVNRHDNEQCIFTLGGMWLQFWTEIKDRGLISSLKYGRYTD